MQPTFEILNLKPVKIGRNFLKHLHRNIFGKIFVPEVFHANQENKTNVSPKKLPEIFIVVFLSESLEKFFVRQGQYAWF